ncbi:MAG: hypothetical protein R2695_10815 [Acidimicrobiales bacterium]
MLRLTSWEGLLAGRDRRRHGHPRRRPAPGCFAPGSRLRVELQESGWVDERLDPPGHGEVDERPLVVAPETSDDR